MNDTVEELKIKGRDAFKAENHRQALNYFTQVIKLEESATNYYHRSEVYYALKQLYDALFDIRKAIVLDPTFAKALLLKSKILLKMKAYVSADYCLQLAKSYKLENANAALDHELDQETIDALQTEITRLLQDRHKRQATNKTIAAEKHLSAEDDFSDIDDGSDESGKLFFDAINERISGRQLELMFGQEQPLHTRHKGFGKEMIARLEEGLPFVQRHLFNKLFVIKIKIKKVKPEIWRQIKLPANISLDVMHDKVIAPCMGWRRNYHAYYFQDAPRLYIEDKKNKYRFEHGTVYGPMKCGAIDYRNHQTTQGLYILDASKRRLGEFLQNTGDKMTYVYDYGDFFEHVITLERIEDATNKELTVELLDGQNACPPEDCQGLYTYAKNLSIFENKNHPKYNEVKESFEDAANYGKLGIPFEPYTFNLTKAKRTLNVALTSEASPMDDSNMIRQRLDTGKLISGLLKKPEKIKLDKTCLNCHKPASKCCSKCKLAFYCSVECQTEHWKKEHKFKCSHLK